MSTATVPIQITCPDWCTNTAEEHVAQLWNLDGDCAHHAAEIEVFDPTGFRRPMSAPRFNDATEVSLSTMASPDGRETESAVVYINDREHTVAQALNVAAAIQFQVEQYRAAGGVE